MNASTQDVLLLFSTGMIVIFRIYYLVRRLWNHPLDHGREYFLGHPVAPGFYEDPGCRWLRRYRTVVLAEHLVEVVIMVAILISGHWYLLPAWAGGSAVLSLAAMFSLRLWARRALGAQLPTRARVAFTLESRRLRDYIAWPLEALIATILGASWFLLLARGGPDIPWLTPLAITYVVAGLLPCKMFVVRAHLPLPAERTEEHQRWFEASRRYSLRVLDSMRWLFLTALAGIAVRQGWPEIQAAAGLRWIFIGAILAVWLYLCFLLIRHGNRLAAMGRSLQPVGSWSSPFGAARMMSPAGWIWNIAFYGGLVLLLLLFFPR